MGFTSPLTLITSAASVVSLFGVGLSCHINCKHRIWQVVPLVLLRCLFAVTFAVVFRFAVPFEHRLVAPVVATQLLMGASFSFVAHSAQLDYDVAFARLATSLALVLSLVFSIGLALVSDLL